MRKYNNDNNSSTGLGFTSVLTIVFVVLKLCKVINWSWLWVLSPLWIGTILWLIIIGIIYLIYRKM